MARIFVGKGRKALVQGIVNRLDNLTDNKGSSRACLISLEAPSGWGKTRIIQEVYKQLAERQASAYWPGSIISEGEDDPVSWRKHLAPSFIGVPRNRDVLPEFFWWGLTCDMRSTNMQSRTLMEDIEQLRFHAPYLEASWAASKLTGLGKYATIAKAKSALGALFAEGAVSGLSKLAELGLGATPFGIGLGLKLVTSGARAVKAKKEEHSQMEKGYEAHETIDQGLVDETVNLFSRLAHIELPIIICVEDIHKATTPVLELLAKLLARNAPILILTTTWPGEFERIGTFQSIFDASWAQDRILRMRYDKASPKGLPGEASLSQLPPDDLGAIVRARYPKAEDNIIELLTARYKNPLPLELVLNMKSLKQDHPYLELDADDVSKLPETVRDLYNSLWNELPEPVQQLLALSTELMPEGQPEWLMTLIADALSGFKDQDWAKDVSKIVANDNIPHGWSRIVEGWLRRFGETDQLNIARAHVGELFGKRQLRLFNEAAAAAIEAFDFNDADIDDVEVTHKAWLALAFFSIGRVNLDANLSASVFLLNSMKGNPFDWSNSLSIGQNALELLSEESPDSLSVANKTIYANIQFLLAWIHHDSGNLDKAINLYRSSLQKRIDLFGFNHSSVFSVRNNIASVLGDMGAQSEAIIEFEKLLVDQTSVLGADHPDILTVRNNIACRTGETGSTLKALEQAKAVLKDRERVLGVDHVDVFSTRNEIAFYLGECGDSNAALEAFNKLLQDQIRVLGAEHYDIIQTKNNIAHWLGKSGRTEDALTHFLSLKEEAGRILGPEHPHYLLISNNIAHLTGESGLFSKALSLFDPILSDQVRILGPSHPYTLITRSNISYFTGQSGEIGKAIGIAETLLKDQMQIFGTKHPQVLNTRNNIAHWLAQSGVLSEALKKFRKLLEDEISILGVNHPKTMNTQEWISRYQEKLDAQEKH